MVKVIGLSDEEIKRGEKLSKLARIAQEVLPDNLLVGSNDFGICVKRNLDMEIFAKIIILPSNIIYVNDESFFDYAVKLAEAYESNGESEFTVKKDYQD